MCVSVEMVLEKLWRKSDDAVKTKPEVDGEARQRWLADAAVVTIEREDSSANHDNLVFRRDVSCPSFVLGTDKRRRLVMGGDADRFRTELSEPWGRFIDATAQLRPELFAFGMQLTGNPFDGEDLVHDALLRAFCVYVPIGGDNYVLTCNDTETGMTLLFESQTTDIVGSVHTSPEAQEVFDAS
jgi:hypothetical protein